MQLIVSNPRHFKFKENLLWLGLTALITAFIWIGYSIYSAYSTSQPDEEIAQLLEPLTPQLDTVTLGDLSSRVRPSESFTIYVGEGVLPLDLPSESASASPLLNLSQ